MSWPLDISKCDIQLPCGMNEELAWTDSQQLRPMWYLDMCLRGVFVYMQVLCLSILNNSVKSLLVLSWSISIVVTKVYNQTCQSPKEGQWHISFQKWRYAYLIEQVQFQHLSCASSLISDSFVRQAYTLCTLNRLQSWQYHRLTESWYDFTVNPFYEHGKISITLAISELNHCPENLSNHALGDSFNP